MKKRRVARAVVGIFLCVVGFLLARITPYRQTTVRIENGGCSLVMDIIDKSKDEAQGSVVLIPGLAANKKIMSYVADGFAEEGLRVFVPDLPGHGRSPGPFTPAHAEECTEALLRQLSARRAIDPAQTIIAGHSLGGAIAILAAAHVPVAGVITLSPAPMKVGHGVRPETLLFRDPPPLPPYTLVISGSLEIAPMRESARETVESASDPTASLVVLPAATHVSLLFDPRAIRASQEWAARVLHLSTTGSVPSLRPLLGFFFGFAGLLLLAGPFLRETVGALPEEFASKGRAEGKSRPDAQQDSRYGAMPSFARICIELLALSLGSAVVLRFWNPFRAFRVFEGDYLAGFLFLTGVGMLLLRHRAALQMRKTRVAVVLAAAFAAIVLFFLITAWFELTFSEAWLTAERWIRVPLFFLAILPCHAAEEIALGPAGAQNRWVRLAMGLLLRLIAWSALLFGIFQLQSGEVLLFLLAPYFVILSVFQRAGMDVVRKETGSALAATVFGAILLAGFCLVIFPVT